MFARISTFQTGPDSMDELSEDAVNQVLQMPGCQGIYYLRGKDNKSLSITLWDDKAALAASEEAANSVRSQISTEHRLQITGVEAFEVLTRKLKD